MCLHVRVCLFHIHVRVHAHIHNDVHVESSALPADMNSNDGQRSATTRLLLPGKVLDLKALSQKRTFRNSGNKAGAVSGIEILGREWPWNCDYNKD